MTDFAALGLAKSLLTALAAKGYDKPTPIQSQSIPSLLQGCDLCGIAQTGTGKTAAFALPLIQQMEERPAKRQPLATRTLVLAPTRELAAQIAASFRDYGKHTSLRVETVFGGVPIGKQIRALSQGVDVLVATPGRLLDLIDQRALSLRNVEFFVLDEADQMLDLGFIHALKRVASLLPSKRQSLFFSATMPKTIAELGNKFLTNPVRVSVAPQSTTAERVDQYVTFVDKREKQALLTITLKAEPIDRALVFSRTKHGADKIVKSLHAAGVGCAAIHGNKSQAQRTQALQAFRSGQVKILIATDIAARGIDVSGVSHVFNFDLPEVAEQYVHRIGRTARAGADGIAISLVDSDERQLLKAIERLTRVQLEPRPLPADFQAESAKLPKPVQAPATAQRRHEDARGGRRDGGQEDRRGPRVHRGPPRARGVGTHRGAVSKTGR